MLKQNRLNKIANGGKDLLAPLFSGLMLIFAFPPFEQGYLAWFALIPLLAACLQLRPARAFWAGFVFGIPLHLYVNLYLAHVLFPHLSTTLAIIAMTSLVLYISLFSGLFSLSLALVNRAGLAWFTALAAPALWLIFEFIRSLSFLGYNVGYLGYTQWNYTLLLNIASLYGYWGLPFLIVFFQILVVLIYRKEIRDSKRYMLSALFVILLAGGIIIPNFMPEHESSRELKALLVQGNSHPELVVEGSQDDILQLYSDYTLEALKLNPEAELVVWPETVARLDFTEQRSHDPIITSLGKDFSVSVFYGARVRKDELLYNSITYFEEEQSKVPVYHKNRLVPFVEFFPMEDLLNRLLELDLLLGSYSAGEKITLFDVKGIPVGAVICFESYFGDHTRHFAREGSRHLFILTNDAWFGESIGLDQHAQAAAIRAAEMGVGVTQVANSGLTISFDHYGQELFRSGKNEPAVFMKSLDLATRDTIYTRYGNYFPAFWALFILITAPLIWLRRS